MDEDLVTIIVAVIAILSSSGFWGLIIQQRAKGDKTAALLIGVAHSLIMSEASRYLERGWVSTREMETFHQFLLKPYLALGGNGLAVQLVEKLHDLPTWKDLAEELELEKLSEK